MHRIGLLFEHGVQIETEEDLDLREGEDPSDALTEYIQDRDTGVWKTIGHITFIWNRLIAFSVEELQTKKFNP